MATPWISLFKQHKTPFHGFCISKVQADNIMDAFMDVDGAEYFYKNSSCDKHRKYKRISDKDSDAHFSVYVYFGCGGEIPKGQVWMQDLDTGGMPYIKLTTEYYWCNRSGEKRIRKSNDKKTEETQEIASEVPSAPTEQSEMESDACSPTGSADSPSTGDDHISEQEEVSPPKKKRLRLKPSMHTNCKANIVLSEVLLYKCDKLISELDFMKAKDRGQIRKVLQTAAKDDNDPKWERRIYITLPTGCMHNHEVGPALKVEARLHPRIRKFIQQKACENITDSKQMRQLVDNYVTNNIYNGNPPDEVCHRYWPTTKDILNNIQTAQKKVMKDAQNVRDGFETTVLMS